MRTLAIVTAIALVSANTTAAAKCKQNLSFEKDPLKDCLTKKNTNDIKRCLDSHLPGLESVNMEADNIVLHLSKPTCLLGSNVHPSARNLQISVSKAGMLIDLVDFRRGVTIGTVTYDSYSACGWTANGKNRLPLIDKFSFIPVDTKITVGQAGCRNGLLDPGNSVELDEAANICDATLPKGTKFSYMPDGAYHFVALSNTKMLYADPDSQSETLIVEKGKDYRNFDPAKSPCIWSETPADVLKSFQDGTSD